MSTPPAGLPIYRVLTGPDDDTFCQRVSEAIGLGYELHEGPAVTFNGECVMLPSPPRSETGWVTSATGSGYGPHDSGGRPCVAGTRPRGDDVRRGRPMTYFTGEHAGPWRL
ncbi:MAG: DUF1737 domain-containing protein [Actinobacteria bacterium]|nr:DUF1737 domain-containing protein [Actinomycetota bacterium]